MRPLEAKRKQSPWPSTSIGGVTFTVSAKVATTINVLAQLLDPKNNPAGQVLGIKWWLSTDPGGLNLSAATTGGIAVGVHGGPIIEDIADVSGFAISDVNGKVDFAITDSGVPGVYIAMLLPDGTLAVSPIAQF